MEQRGKVLTQTVRDASLIIATQRAALKRRMSTAHNVFFCPADALNALNRRVLPWAPRLVFTVTHCVDYTCLRVFNFIKGMSLPVCVQLDNSHSPAPRAQNIENSIIV